MPENNSTIPPLVFGAPSLSFYGIYPRHLERFTPISLPQLFRYGYYNMNEVEITHGEAEYCLKNGEQIKVYPAFPIWDCYFRYSNELLKKHSINRIFNNLFRFIRSWDFDSSTSSIIR